MTENEKLSEISAWSLQVRSRSVGATKIAMSPSGSLLDRWRSQPPTRQCTTPVSSTSPPAWIRATMEGLTRNAPFLTNHSLQTGARQGSTGLTASGLNRARAGWAISAQKPSLELTVRQQERDGATHPLSSIARRKVAGESGETIVEVTEVTEIGDETMAVTVMTIVMSLVSVACLPRPRRYGDGLAMRSVCYSCEFSLGTIAESLAVT
mmetsp:Transcript_65212/g.172809  ORF Transcript_65212/g.172809 Transcript_65212/m.172809 type:complete len:209 (-) Transcript_65212:86-712(-)